MALLVFLIFVGLLEKGRGSPYPLFLGNYFLVGLALYMHVYIGYTYGYTDLNSLTSGELRPI
jgi:hypothetical protein